MIRPFEILTTDIEGLYLINPFVAYDERGYFIKDYSKEIFEKSGIVHDLKEAFYTNSHKGVIRALHFQRVHGQAKLVRCVHGRIYDVVVDLRAGSKTFKKWLAFELSEENKMELLIPEYCGHGYLVLEDAIVTYKCSEKFYGEYDDGILWDDADIGIDWPLDIVDNQIILAEKDLKWQTFKQFVDSYGGL